MNQLARSAPAYLLAAFLVFMGVQKFVGDVPIFKIIEANVLARTGLNIDLIDPAGRYMTGALELLAAILLILRRFWGALLSTGVIAGAILAHLTFLGISTPMSSGTDAPESPMLFIMALIFFGISILVLWLARLIAAEKSQPLS
ncbi:MAG TPA: hypothetical protein PKV67_00300 [Hyphomonas sp.]|nr:hypothetical protein [Hyphomonas sp.]HRI99186.1 hypothetical protein [Hyphomonas sp.]HRK65933.1 hypothetical protein [Hyphomonas sp.]